MFFTLFGFFLQGRGGPKGAGVQPADAVFRLPQLKKWKFPKLIFFYILTIHNDQISYVKHVLDTIHVLFTLFGCLDGGKGLGHNLLMQFSTLPSSKMEFFKSDFFELVTIHNDQISCVNHVLDPLYVFFTLFCCWGGGDGGFLNDFVTS